MKMLVNSMRRVPLEDLAALCKYFDCTVGDILVYVPDEPQKAKNQ